jgi:cytochrome c oxidase subunit II
MVFFLAGCSSKSGKKTVNNENVKKGEALFKSVGCSMCHSISGDNMYGPSLNSILNTDVIVVRDGKERSLKIDRDYILRSIQNPEFEKVVDFKDRKMPKPELAFDQIECITDYLIFVNSK